MTPLPRPPTGNHPLVQTIRQIVAILRELRIQSSPDIEIDRTAEGTRLRVRKSGGGGGSAPAQIEPARYS